MSQESLIYIVIGGAIFILAIIYLLVVKRRPKKDLKNEEESSFEEDSLELTVYKDPIPDIKGITLDNFKDFAGSSILAVDDNPINLKLIVRMMEGSGINLDTAVDGSDALKKLKQDRYDLVLMDINMPVMNGLECTEAIRKDSDLCYIPVVALSAATSADMIEKMLDSGMNGYLEKPLVLGKLFNAFKLFIDTK